MRSVRAFEDEAKARLGVVECAKHELLQPFSVLHEKDGEKYYIIKWHYFILNDQPSIKKIRLYPYK